MKLHNGPELTLNEARALIRLAVAKAEDLGAAGAFVVVNEGGVPISAFASRMANNFPGIFQSYQQLARDGVFPGQGAFVVRAHGTVVGAMSTGAGIGPFVKWPGLSTQTETSSRSITWTGPHR